MKSNAMSVKHPTGIVNFFLLLPSCNPRCQQLRSEESEGPGTASLPELFCRSCPPPSHAGQLEMMESGNGNGNGNGNRNGKGRQVKILS